MKDFEITIYKISEGPVCSSYTFIRALNAGLARRAIIKELGLFAHLYHITAL